MVDSNSVTEADFDRWTYWTHLTVVFHIYNRDLAENPKSLLLKSHTVPIWSVSAVTPNYEKFSFMPFSSQSAPSQREYTSNNAIAATPERQGSTGNVLPAIDGNGSLIRAEHDGQTDNSFQFVQIPGGMHRYQVTTEPEAMDAGDMSGADRGVYRIHYRSIDEGTQTADLTGEISIQSKDPEALGGYSDIYKGVWTHRVSVDQQTSQARSVVGAVQNRRHWSY